MFSALYKRNFCFSILLILLLFIFSGKIFGQSLPAIDSVKKKISQYAVQHPSAMLFVHFDKNVYANNEHVWFTGYLLKNNTNAEHHILGVALIRTDDRSVLAEGKFKMENGLAFGHLILPDSLPAGNYTFICYTDHLVNEDPSALFQQPVTIKSSKTDGFIVELILRDSVTRDIDSVRILLRAYKQDLSVVSKASVKYFIGDRINPLLNAKATTDKIGEAEFKIPLRQINPLNNILQAEVSNGTEIKTFSLKLPVYKKDTSVKFYPEGGNLVTGTQNIVGWEAKTNDGEPLQVEANLFENNKLLQAIYTDANGMGKFSLIPQPESHYYIKLKNNGDSIYTLPALLDKMPALTVTNALASDTLVMELSNPLEGQQLSILIHDYYNTYLEAPITSTAKHINLRIALEDVPKGLHALTLIDALGRPVAERIFFAHYDNRELVSISTDTSFYATRQKVKLKIKITNALLQPSKAVFSIACVQSNRIDPKKMTDIESYVYLKNPLSPFPYRSQLMNDAENKAYLEMVLLIKGWRRYIWKDVEKANDDIVVPQNDSLTFRGFVVRKDKELKKPMNLIATNVIDSKISGLDEVTTDSTGKFILPADFIENLSSNGVIKLSVFNEDKLDYRVTVIDPYKDMNKRLGAALSFETDRFFISSQTSRSNVLPAGEVAKQMATVVIKTQKDNSIYWSSGANECGDYVCMFNILNCLNHPPGTSGTHAPVVGGFYMVNGVRTSYYGCSELWKGKNKSYEAIIDGIRTPMEFYVEDLSKKEVSGPQYLSTIFWKHAIVTDEKGEASVEFYTGDITGRFRIVVQGITDNDVIYGDRFFEVEK
jgi:hypothetical protein